MIRYYDKDKNPSGEGYPGIPLDDITESRWEGLSDYDKQVVDSLPFYRKTKPQGWKEPKDTSGVPGIHRDKDGNIIPESLEPEKPTAPASSTEVTNG